MDREKLTPEQVNQFNDFLTQKEAELDSYPNNQQYPAYYPDSKQNLIEWELDFKPELDSIIHLLKCDVLVKDENGNTDWQPNPNPERVLFNDWGVNDIIRNIVTIVNKGKALSNYTSEEINERVRQIKHEIRTLIYNNYEVYGMDNEYKVNNYSIVVLAIGSIIEDVYRRAMGGETHKGLSEQRLVSQTEPIAHPNQTFNMYPQNQKRSVISRAMPWNWGKGAYG